MSLVEIKSAEIEVNRNTPSVYNFLSDMKNYEGLMPDEVVDFSANQERAQMNIRGLGEFEISISDQVENENLVLTPKGKLPFKFDIKWSLRRDNDKTFITGVVLANLNPFMKMMAEKKLMSFVNAQADKMKEHVESGIPE